MYRSITAAIFATGLTLAVSVPASASQVASLQNQEHWGEWRALSEGFVGRRREPPGLQRAVEERRLPEVQVQARLLDRPGQQRLEGVVRTQELLKEAREIGADSSAALNEGALGRGDLEVLSLAGGSRGATSAWLKTGEPGLYAVSLDELSSQAGMPPWQLRVRARTGRLNLFNDGQPVSWHYDQSSNHLLFAAEAYESFYSTGNAYQLVFAQTRDPHQMSATQAALPRQGRAGRNAVTPAAGQATPFRDTVRFEEEPDMFFSPWVAADDPDADFWFWDFLFGGFKDTIDLPLDLPNPAATGWGELRVELRGRTRFNPGNEHHVYAEINGQRVGSVAWDGFDAATLVAQFDQGLLNPGGSNSIRLGSIYPEGTTPGQFLNAIEVDYQRMPVAREGQLWIRGAGGGTQTVTGFGSADVLVIESPIRNASLHASVQAYRQDGGWSVDFVATPGTDYLLVESSALRSAAISGPATADLRNRRNGAEYLIIAPRELAGTAEALAQHRRASFGAVNVVWLDDIYKEFGAGRVDPFAIGRFMQTAMSGWRQSPSMVVLVGKGSLDHKDRMGYGDSFIPVVMTSNPWSLAASDSRLLGFDDGITPFAYGRLAIMNDAEGLAYVEKLRRHEARVRTGERGAVVTADNPDQAGDFHAYALQTTQRLFDLGFDVAWQFLHPTHQVRAALVDSDTWDAAVYVVYDGHGSVQQIGDSRERFLTVSDALALGNENLPVFTALTCASGDDSMPATRSLASALVLNPEGGAIASLAPTGLSLGRDAHVLGMAFVDGLFGGNQTVGPALVSAKRSVDGRVGGFMSPMYTVLGDPAVGLQ